jgi:uncharacterized protein (DUF3084 family)
MLSEMRSCSPALNFTQDKTAKAEEEVTLLEEQSQDYKDQLDKALRQIEKLSAKSQSVWYISSTFTSDPDCPFRVTRGHVHGCSLIVDQTKSRPKTLCIRSCRLPSRRVVTRPLWDLPAGSPHRSKSQALTHAFSLSLKY